MIIGRKYGVDALFFFPLVDRGTIDYVSGPTIAAGDAKIFTNRQISTNTTAEVVAFTSGSEEPAQGDVLLGATSASDATVMFVVVTSGTWFGGDAAGFLFLKSQTGAFQAENLDISGGTANVLTIGGDTARVFVSLGNGNYAIALTATEMTCANGSIHIVDSATKEWEDQAILFETYGNALAQHAVDLDNVAAIKAKTDLIPASPAAVGSAMTLTSGERNNIATALLDLADGIEPASGGTERTLREAVRLILAAAAGKANGLATTTANYRDTNDTKNRISATVDANGNRSAVTLDDT